MQEINERFKDARPEDTVARIQGILKSLGIVLEELWTDSGLEDCWSLNVRIPGSYSFFANGKGITKALARASAYGEFIERLQCGLFLYKFQSIGRDPRLNLQSYAPDGKYMTVQELEENGEWMDPIIAAYGHGLTRKKLAQQCLAYACTDSDQILTLPFYSLFEDKTVYLPAGFVEHMYAANGCCAGNSPQEACIHALSEIMERSCTVRALTSGEAVPALPDSLVNQFPTAAKILAAIRDSGRYDVQLLDFSNGSGFPVIGTRIIDRHTHRYNVNVCADPILEIAMDRTLSELLQGKNIRSFSIRHNGALLEELGSLPVAHNVLNQLETGSGIFSLNFFANEVTCDRECGQFPELRSKNNRELLAYMLDMYRSLGKPLYIRNYAFLGFDSYHIVVPGFSENRGLRLVEPVCEYALGDMVYKTFRNAAAAGKAELVMLLNFHNRISTALSRVHNFAGLAGLPLDPSCSLLLMYTTLSYAACRLGRLDKAAAYLETLLKGSSLADGDASYLRCVQRYWRLKHAGTEEPKLRLVLEKLYETQDVQRLYACLDQGETPVEGYLLRCDGSCWDCRYQTRCGYTACADLLEQVGKRYRAFEKGQDLVNFAEILGCL